MPDPVTTATANATFAATLVDEWVRCGVRHAVVAPGSRSTPMTLALASRSELELHIVHDERVAGFVALGIGLASGVPAVLVCTSGTASANFHPAVAEASLSAVPMIVATADRPPELRGVGAAQTIDQLDLYGRMVRWHTDAPPPDDADPAGWRPLAQRAYAAAEHGPVHVNLPFREPLVGTAAPLPAPIGPPVVVPRAIMSSGPLRHDLDRPHGLLIVGGRAGVDAAAVAALATRLRWPLLADPTSGLRDAPNAITAFDSLLRHAGFAADHRPEVVVRVGRPPASKVLTQWLVASGVPVVQVGGPGPINPDHNVVAWATLDDLAGVVGASDDAWLDGWRRADAAAEAEFDALLAKGVPDEPSVARTVATALPADVGLFVSSSMPIRDLEWFGGRAARAESNRGANGIDGVVATALGTALADRPAAVLIGDLAYLHDSNALLATAQLGADVRIVVVDNRGGGIFSFLPQASSMPEERFERLFGTPHDTDLVALAAAHGIPATTATTLDEVAAAVRLPGPSVTRIVSERTSNVVTHAAWHDRAIEVLR